MKIIYKDDQTPRSDNHLGSPTGLTIGNIYEVVEIEHSKYTVLNNDNKLARYSKHRFIVINDVPPKGLRFSFNMITSPMRQRIAELEKQLSQRENTL